MSKQPFQDDSSVAAKLFAALGSATADALRELFSTTGQLEWSELTAQLDRDGESYFYWAKSYCERWAREGEPRPTSSVPRPHHTMSEGFDPWADLPQDSTPEPLALWDSEQAQMCRGALRGSLRKLIPPRDEATSETPGLNDAKRSVAPGDATFKALAVSDHTPDTTATEGAPVDRERGSATKVDPSDVLAMFMNMELLWMETWEHSADGLAGYDRLFGEEDLYSALTVLGDCRADFSKRFPGVVQTIADFAVTSGHEAAAFFASRVANYAKVRRRSIPEHRAALAAARETKNEAQIVALKHKLDQASRHFAESMQKAFNGWFEHRAWMQRSIEQEAREFSRAPIAEPVVPITEALPSDPLERWYALRPDWGRPRSKDGGRPVVINWQTHDSIATGVQLAGILEALLPQARAANPHYSLLLLEMVHNLRDGVFLTSHGRDPTIALLSKVDLVVADLRAIRREKACALENVCPRDGDVPDQASARDALHKDEENSADTDRRHERPGGASALADDWHPSAHQEQVLALLKRDGRLRTGVLWTRISPKHLDKRAHQNAMRDLVVRRKVLTDGKGRATEYWLP